MNKLYFNTIIVDMYDSCYWFSLTLDNTTYYRNDIDGVNTPNHINDILKHIYNCYNYYDKIKEIINEYFMYELFYIIDNSDVVHCCNNLEYNTVRI